nr:hypothetical protein CFP56_56568 [Quercus suber]
MRSLRALFYDLRPGGMTWNDECKVAAAMRRLGYDCAYDRVRQRQNPSLTSWKDQFGLVVHSVTVHRRDASACCVGGCSPRETRWATKAYTPSLVVSRSAAHPVSVIVRARNSSPRWTVTSHCAVVEMPAVARYMGLVKLNVTVLVKLTQIKNGHRLGAIRTRCGTGR